MGRVPGQLRLVICLAVLCCAEAGFSLEIVYRVVALTGQEAPGTNGALFSAGGFQLPVIDESDRVAFVAGLDSTAPSGTRAGIWSEGPGSLTLIAREGDTAPQTSNQFTPFFSDLIINDLGQVAFRGVLRGEGVSAGNDRGVWSEGKGDLALVAREGDSAPGTGEIFTLLTNPLVFNNLGHTAFRANLSGSTGTDSVWSESNDLLAPVGRTSLIQPPPDGSFTSFRNPVMDSDSRSCFYASVSGPPGEHTVQSEGPGSLQAIAQSGASAPGCDLNNDSFPYGSVDIEPDINNDGLTAFNGICALPTGVLAALWKETKPTQTDRASNGPGASQNVVELVAMEFDNAPDTAESFRNFDSPVISHSGKIAVRAFLYGSATANVGYWSDTFDSLALVTRKGAQAPGYAPGVTFTFVTPTSLIPAMNGDGDLAFIGTVEGPGIDGTNNVGVFAEVGGTLELIVRTGQIIEIEPGKEKTVGHLGFITATGNEDGRPSAFNDSGRLTFFARFTDGIEGILVADTGDPIFRWGFERRGLGFGFPCFCSMEGVCGPTCDFEFPGS